MELKDLFEVGVFICNALGLVLGLYVKNSVNELKTLMYRDFITKSDFENIFKRR